MLKKEIEEKLLLIYDSFGIDAKNLKVDTSIGDLGLDSLDIIEFGLIIEDEFGFEIPIGEKLTFLSTHEDILELIITNTVSH